jgi:hypothetical protein
VLSGTMISVGRTLEKLGPALYSPECVEVVFSEVRLTAYYCGTTATASISTKKSG